MIIVRYVDGLLREETAPPWTDRRPFVVMAERARFELADVMTPTSRRERRRFARRRTRGRRGARRIGPVLAPFVARKTVQFQGHSFARGSERVTLYLPEGERPTERHRDDLVMFLAWRADTAEARSRLSADELSWVEDVAKRTTEVVKEWPAHPGAARYAAYDYWTYWLTNARSERRPMGGLALVGFGVYLAELARREPALHVGHTRPLIEERPPPEDKVEEPRHSEEQRGEMASGAPEG